MAELRNIRLTLAYDGTRYRGWQVQPEGPTLQGVLTRAIQRLTNERCAVFSAGRTDAGVHALGQVANFHTRSQIPAANFRPALQSHLPEDVVILDSREAPPEFHATFSAVAKRYRYVIDNGPVPLPFLRNYAWSIRRPLDAAAMHEAAQVLAGTHDFRSFETDWPNKATSVRTVHKVSVDRRPAWPIWLPGAAPWVTAAEAQFILFEIEADGFLYNMVRSIVGTLVYVGRGKWNAANVRDALVARCRSRAGATAPARGLYLVEVSYADAPRCVSLPSSGTAQ
jgi:tRNA pseudouridine38-40 synthase